MTHVEAVVVVKRLKRVLLAWLSWKEVLKEVWWKMENAEVGKWWLRKQERSLETRGKFILNKC